LRAAAQSAGGVDEPRVGAVCGAAGGYQLAGRAGFGDAIGAAGEPVAERGVWDDLFPGRASGGGSGALRISADRRGRALVAVLECDDSGNSAGADLYAVGGDDWGIAVIRMAVRDF